MERPATILGNLALILFGLLLTVGLEFFLRLVWRSAPQGDEIVWTRIDPYEKAGSDMVTRERYLPAFRPVRFSAMKPRGTYRIFCIGGSSTGGYPFAAAAAWPAQLERRIKALSPNVRVEVINAAGLSYGSARNLGVMRGILDYEPDVVIVNAGNNEFVEDSYRAALDSRMPVMDFVRSLHLYKALARVILVRHSGPRVVSAEGAGAFLFSPFLDGTVYSPTPQRRREVTALFRGNLEQLASLAAERGLRLILCTSPSNELNWTPDPDRSAPGDPGVARRWRALFEKGKTLEKQGSQFEAAVVYAEAAATWELNAEFCFRYGQTLFALGRVEQARTWLAKARDLDPAPVRASTEINGIVRAITAARAIPLADLERAFEDVSPSRLVGDDLIVDNVHPTPRGHAIAAREVWRSLVGLGEPWSTVQPDAEDSYSVQEHQRGGESMQLDANMVYVWGQIFEKKGMTEQAIGMFEKSIAMGNNLPYPRFSLAYNLYKRGDISRALALLEKVAEEYPDFKEPHPLLALLYRASGNADQSLRYFRLSLAGGTTDTAIFHQYAGLLREQGKYREALDILNQALSRQPGACELLADRGLVLEMQGDETAAQEAYRATLARDPGCPMAWENLGLLQMKRGEWVAAVSTFQEALRQPGPAVPYHHLNLGICFYEGLHDREAAVEQFRIYLEMNPNDAEKVPEELREQVARGGRRR